LLSRRFFLNGLVTIVAPAIVRPGSLMRISPQPLGLSTSGFDPLGDGGNARWAICTWEPTFRALPLYPYEMRYLMCARYLVSAGTLYERVEDEWKPIAAGS